MAKNKLNFTDERLRNLSPDGSGKRLYFYDTTQTGLALQITPKGSKTFQMQAWSKKHERSVVKTIGAYPKFSISEARSHALKSATISFFSHHPSYQPRLPEHLYTENVQMSCNHP